jgi:ABC-type multidrug transport system fused ATPase/permease subunit
MDRSLYRYIFKHSKRSQIVLLILILAMMPVVYVTLELPKLIVNQAIEGEEVPESLFGFEMDQIRYLFILCIGFLLSVIITGLLKLRINVIRGSLGEKVLRGFRYTLYEQVLRFPLPRFKQVSQGEIIPMITAETEPLGEFIGESFSLPIQQGGLLITYLVFIFLQNFWLGLAAISLYPFQLWLIPRLQRSVNVLAKKRVRKMREVAGEVGETVSGIVDIHGNDTSRFERAGFDGRLQEIYSIRLEIFRRKFFIKFLNNFIAQLTPFFFYLVGGYFVIRGDLSLGALIAVLAAYKDLSGPWKELLRYYQRKEDIRVKYLQIVDQFSADDLLDKGLLDNPPVNGGFAGGKLRLRNLTFAESENSSSVRGISLDIDLDKHLQISGDSHSGKEDLARLLARLYLPTSGSLLLNGRDTADLPESTTGRAIAYAGADSYLFAGSLFDNIVYGLKHTHVAGPPPADSDHPVGDPIGWIDLSMAGAADAVELERKLLDITDELQMGGDLFRFGMGQKVDGSANEALASDILRARVEFRRRQDDNEDLRRLVEPFSADAYNANMSVAENLLFGSVVGEDVDLNALHLFPQCQKVLAETGLDERFLDIGYELAELMVELFAGVEPGSPIFDQFSFIRGDDLGEVQAILSRRQPAGGGKSKVTTAEQNLIRGLPFQLVVARHRLGLIDEEMQHKIVSARASLAERLRSSGMTFEPYGQERFQGSLSIQDNILFGKVVYGQANAEDHINREIDDIISDLGIHQQVVVVGLQYQVGVAGARLNQSMRQRVALCRGLLKQPTMLVANEATNALDAETEASVIAVMQRRMAGRCLIWVTDSTESLAGFDRHISLSRGRVEQEV